MNTSPGERIPRRPTPETMLRQTITSLDEAPYRISDLTEKTGVSRETIRFYINEGLLPPPFKTARNMGWYSERHVQLLQLIQKLQQERFLPLKAIKSLMHGIDESEFSDSQNEVLADLRQRLMRDHGEVVVAADPAAVAEWTALPPNEQKELQEFGIAPHGVPSASDLEIVRIWIQIRDAALTPERGFSPRDVEFMFALVGAVIEEEVRMFRDRIRTVTPDEAAKLRDIVIPGLSKIFAVLHERHLMSFLESYFSTKEPQVGSKA